MRQIRVPTTPCVYCGAGEGGKDSIVYIDEGLPDPKEGDVIWCLECHGMMMVAPDGVRKATLEEVKADPVVSPRWLK